VSTGWLEGDVTIDDTTIHYYRRGSGPPVVLAHGALDDGRCWTRVAEALELDYDLIAYDARFHGKSDAPPGGVRPGADDLVGIIETLGLDRPYAIGHSMGAGTVAATLATRPELIRAAVLEDPGWRDPPVDAEEAGKFLQMFAEMLSGKTVEEIAALGREASPTWDASEFEPWATSKAAFRGQEMFGGRHRFFDDWESACGAFRCPVLLVCGGNDALGRIVTPEVAARAGELCPTLESVCLEPAGHNVRREAYDEYVTMVRAFLRRS
jgi:N-formylmaleamate deformylase